MGVTVRHPVYHVIVYKQACCGVITTFSVLWALV